MPPATYASGLTASRACYGDVPRELRVLRPPLADAVQSHPGRVGPEGVGDDDVRADLQVVLVDLAHEVGGLAKGPRRPGAYVARGTGTAGHFYPAPLELGAGAAVHQQQPPAAKKGHNAFAQDCTS